MNTKSSLVLCAVIGLVLLSGHVHADCDEKAADGSEFKQFFKNLGCKVSQGADTVVEAAKPFATKIGESAKELGSTVAQKYDDLKHHLSTDESSSTRPAGVQYDAPTERVPLAPIAPGAPAEITNNQPMTA